MAGLTDQERQEILARRQATPSGGTFSPFPGMELQGATIGKTPSLRYGQPKEKTLAATTQRDLSRISAFEGSLNDLESLAKSVPKGRVKGNLANLSSWVTGGGPGLGLSEESSRNTLTYNQLRPGIAAGLYRAVTGDDRISDMDAAARALPFVPPFNIDPDAFSERLKIIRSAIKRRKESIREASRTGTEPPISDFGSMLSGATREDTTAQSGGQLMEDAQGNRAYVYPDGRVEELP